MSKLMDYINTKILDDELNEDEKRIKKKLKISKSKVKDLASELNYLKDKYVALLEEKGESFNQYIYWQNKSNEYELNMKEMKKTLIDLKQDFKDFENVVSKYFTRDIVTSLAECENYDDFMTYILGIYFKNKEIPLGVNEVCKKINITKSMIEKESRYLYEVLDVNNWDINER